MLKSLCLLSIGAWAAVDTECFETKGPFGDTSNVVYKNNMDQLSENFESGMIPSSFEVCYVTTSFTNGGQTFSSTRVKSFQLELRDRSDSSNTLLLNRVGGTNKSWTCDKYTLNEGEEIQAITTQFSEKITSQLKIFTTKRTVQVGDALKGNYYDRAFSFTDKTPFVGVTSFENDNGISSLGFIQADLLCMQKPVPTVPILIGVGSFLIFILIILVIWLILKKAKPAAPTKVISLIDEEGQDPEPAPDVRPNRGISSEQAMKLRLAEEIEMTTMPKQTIKETKEQQGKDGSIETDRAHEMDEDAQ